VQPVRAEHCLKRDKVMSLTGPRRYLALLGVPLRPAGAVTLVVLSATLTLALMAGPFGLPLAAILLGWFFKYSLEFLDRVASGNSEAPVLSLETVAKSMGEFRWLVPLGFAILFFFISGVASPWLARVAAAAIALGVVFCLPPMLVIQGWTGRLSHSLNPYIWRIAVRILGRDYGWLVLCACLLLVFCALVPGAIDKTPTMLRLVLRLYGWLAFVAVTGGALNAKREPLDEQLPLVIPHYSTVSSAAVEKDREQWLDRVYASWRANALANAFAVVTQRMDRDDGSLMDLRWLMRRISTWHPPSFSNRVATLLISRLLNEGRNAEALQVARDRVAVDSDFELEDGQAGLRLAKIAAECGDDSLLNVFKSSRAAGSRPKQNPDP
jgi:hypothetical protein